MIVKKMPILQAFPDIDYVKKISKSVYFDCGNHPVFYDIETTGLSRYSSFLYLIGALAQENGNWFLYQWMAENEREEQRILCEFFDFMKNATATFQYNGASFDQPYLEERYKKHNLPSPFEGIPAMDLYRELKPCRELLKLDKMKLTDMEGFLGMSERVHCDGGACIRIYRSYIRSRDPGLLETILGHNEEDLIGLENIFHMLSYRLLFTGKFIAETACIEDGTLLMRFQLPLSVPAPVSKKGTDFYFTCQNGKGAFMTNLKDGRARRYYQNYKDYDYIPGEETAVPKALSRYMDKSLRCPAKPETCFTWFRCGEEFLRDSVAQSSYLNGTLPCLLKLKQK